MVNLSALFVGLIFFLPILMAVLFLLINSGARKILTIITILSLSLGVLVLILLGEVVLDTPLVFLGETITFSVSNTGLFIFLLILLILLGMILIYSEKANPFKLGIKSSLLSLSLSLGFIAFISGQFLIRYIALEVVGLLAAALALNSFDDKESYKRFSVIFTILRFGDLSLLAAILLLYHHAGTLDIAQMMTAVSDLPITAQTWIMSGFVLAILVKISVWPFSQWMHQARHGTEKIHFWVSGILIPSLGYYLLYRILPFIDSNIYFRNLSVFLGVGIALTVFLKGFLKTQNQSRFCTLGGVYSAYLFISAAFGSKDYFKYLVLGFLIYRLLLLASDKFTTHFFKTLYILFPFMINIIYGITCPGHCSFAFKSLWFGLSVIVLVWHWHLEKNEKFWSIKNMSALENRRKKANGWIQRAAAWLKQHVEINILTDGVYSLATGVSKSAAWINEKVEVGFFNNGFFHLSDAIEGSASWISDWVEKGMERLWSWLGDNLVAISEDTFLKFEVDSAQKSEVLLDNALNSLDKYEQQVLKKNLRLDLVWIPLFLIIVLVLIISV